jgi:hypothetical protein
VEILQNNTLAETLGKNGKEYVRQKFLNTRLVGNYLDLICELTT